MRLSFVLAMAAPLVAFAGNRDNFEPCSKSNECRSQTCAAGLCEPTGSWNGHGVLGSRCKADSNCASRVCSHAKCQPPKEKKETSRPSSSGGSARPAATVDDHDETPPEPAALPVANDLTDPVVLDACGKDLRATVFENEKGDFRDHYARAACSRFKPEVIAKAKALWAKGYGGFTHLAEQYDRHSDAEVECAQKQFDALPAEKKRAPLTVHSDCWAKKAVDAGALEACISDLTAAVFPNHNDPVFAQRKSKELCEKYSAQTLATVKALDAQGFVRNFQTACGHVDQRTPDEIACARKKYEPLEGKERSRLDFIIPSECREKRK